MASVSHSAPTLQELRWQSRTEMFLERLAGLELAMVRIPAGTFVMGSPPDELERRDNEGPQRQVALGEFLLGRTPITQAQWRTVAQWPPPAGERWRLDLNPAPSFFQPGAKASEFETSLGARFSLLEGETTSDERPVERVRWHEAMEFCRRLNSRLGPGAGRHYTLPSEAQWEYACRAGTSTPFHFGATITPELANYDGDDTYANGPNGANRRQTTPVGMFPANAWGLQDMHGNVLEWCLDHWHASYEGAPADGSAWVNPSRENKEVSLDGETDNSEDKDMEDTEGRLLRGGSWYHLPRNCRSAYRGLGRPVNANADVGFRVVCLPQGPSLNA
jgi:formylglycine-generating enzyme required for sulfatase activity